MEIKWRLNLLIGRLTKSKILIILQLYRTVDLHDNFLQALIFHIIYPRPSTWIYTHNYVTSMPHNTLLYMYVCMYKTMFCRSESHITDMRRYLYTRGPHKHFQSIRMSQQQCQYVTVSLQWIILYCAMYMQATARKCLQFFQLYCIPNNDTIIGRG